MTCVICVMMDVFRKPLILADVRERGTRRDKATNENDRSTTDIVRPTDLTNSSLAPPCA